jgi:hypothetical protein
LRRTPPDQIHPDLGTPRAGDYDAAPNQTGRFKINRGGSTELGAQYQLLDDGGCLADENVRGRSAPEIWPPPDANRRPPVSLSTRTKNKPCGAPPLSDAIPAAPADRHPSGSGMRLSTASAKHSVEQILQPELNSIRQRMIHRIVWIGRHV